MIERPPFFRILPFLAGFCVVAGIIMGLFLFVAFSKVGVWTGIMQGAIAVLAGFVSAAFIHAFASLVESNLAIQSMLTRNLMIISTAAESLDELKEMRRRPSEGSDGELQ